MDHEAPKRVLLAGLLLFPMTLRPQMPPPPARLVISSQPVGATITINGTRMSQKTDATFIVSPGSYTVSVASTDLKANCGDIRVSVAAGETHSMSCIGSVWK
jgi:hypothetical protein